MTKGIPLIILFCAICASAFAQSSDTVAYKKRVLDATEIEFLSSYYSQDGDHAAVSGGIGSEKITNTTGAVVLSIPLNDDDVLTLDVGISAYSSASSSNINPLDDGKASPYDASSGASSSDLWAGISATYSHSSDDRNSIWSLKASASTEFDYTSFGFGGGYTRLFNEKNTELSINASVFLDTWKLLYPYELGGPGGDDDSNVKPFDPKDYTITGNPDYNPGFRTLDDDKRNSYAAGIGLSQIFTDRLQGILLVDVIHQSGLLSTPFQRVYFQDKENSYIDDFALADDIERLPSSRLKVATGGRMNYYISEIFVLRTFYRFYSDDWGINSHTANIEMPVRLFGGQFSVTPSYRFYTQTESDHFAPYDQHLSTDEFYTSDYDLSAFDAHQYGLELTYSDILTRYGFGKFKLKDISLSYNSYNRSTEFTASIISFRIKMVLD
ncbi:hypothetical protein FUAX_02740 [Fulvitalea axinellae]|uniref:DUF3570 domain-containing protein n=1 Tax=Fulvitalea axinellae TaxID=1182444 RepID=A0AAU9CJ05_9BACT|nr:hypothetical protein FUAX_02740 [Fulvitalea axinellae]